jgi:ribosomal protein L20A (L18A)
MMMWNVTGTIKLGREERKFAKHVEAKTENMARDKTYALFGSQNGVRRTSIKIEKVEKEGA